MPHTAATSPTSAPVPLSRALPIFFVIIVAVFLAGALLAYPLYLCLSPLFTIDFQKVEHYAIVLTGLGLGLYYLHTTRQIAGLYGRGRGYRMNLKTLVKGFAAGVAVLLVVELSLLLLGMRQTDPDLANGPMALLFAIIKALLTGAIVGLMEETLYRGAIYTGLACYTSTRAALWVSAICYGAVHFIEIPELPAGAAVTWLSGLSLLTGAFYQFTDPLILDAWFSLILLGLFFGLLRRHSGGLMLCIGAHAGIVTMNKIFSYATEYQAGTTHAYMVNAYDHQTGLLASFWLMVACVLTWLVLRRNHRGP